MFIRDRLKATMNQSVERESFSKIPAFVDVPDLLSIQTWAYQQFLQEWIPNEARKPIGLEGVFRNVFPIEDSHRNYILEYKNYYLGQPKYSPNECMDRGVTYSAPLRVRLALHITDENNKNEYAQSIEQDVYFGNIPYMTAKGTFIINGAERVIVSQLQRSPGVFFDESIHPNGTKLYQARIIPARGSWVDFTTDINDCFSKQKEILSELKDFFNFCSKKNIKLYKSIALHEQKTSNINKINLNLKNLSSELGIFLIEN